MKRRLQVFISSTYTDLIAERQAAVSAVLKAGHIPAGMELFTAGDRSQMETIKQWIDESDVYMLILGGRYGSIEPAAGVSYTELEYDYALQQQKPLFAVVVTEKALELKVKADGSSVVERDNAKELAQFRRKVLANISSFFDDPKDIKLCVHETLAEFATTRALRGWVQADEVVDTKPLFEEIRKLSDENRQLKDALAEVEKRAATRAAKQSESLQELRRILAAIEVKIPATLADGTERAVPLLTLFYGNRDTFINGVTNRADASEGEHFFFHSVCPKLQVHGLAVNERVTGAKYRRYAITALGNSLLAEIEKGIVLAPPSEANSANEPSVRPSPVPEEGRKAGRKRAPARSSDT